MGDPVNPRGGLDNPIVLLCRLHRWRMAFFGLIILLAGMLGGAAATLLVLRCVGQKTPPSAELVVAQMLGRLGDRLGLMPDQAKQLRPILQRHVQKLHGIREEGRTAIVQELELLDRDVSQVLDKDQKRLWRELHEPLARQFRRGPLRYGLGPGGWMGAPGEGRGLLYAPSRSLTPDANAARHN
jgi:hypothetical protein